MSRDKGPPRCPKDLPTQAARRTIRVMVAWATPTAHEVAALEVPAGTTVVEAVALSRIAERHGIDLASVRFGVFGQRRAPESLLEEGDRVELWRPLRVDPKEARRRRGEARSRRGRRAG